MKPEEKWLQKHHNLLMKMLSYASDKGFDVSRDMIETLVDQVEERLREVRNG